MNRPVVKRFRDPCCLIQSVWECVKTLHDLGAIDKAEGTRIRRDALLDSAE